MRLIVISGRSGSGKSTALHVLEDIGFTCVDNLPATLLPDLVRQLQQHRGEQGFAVSIDARNTWKQLKDFPALLAQAMIPGLQCDILFLDASNSKLIQRFSETRRKHPLSDQTRDLREAIELERQLLEPIANSASLVIDTTELTLHELRDLVKQRILGRKGPGMAIQFQSFGYKHGVPVDGDFVFDVRCLPNPHWMPHLRALTGRDQDVIDFLCGQEDVEDMFTDISRFLERWIPRFEANNRSYFTVSIGCTGGQHRSVYLTERLHEAFAERYDNVQVRHRELTKK